MKKLLFALSLLISYSSINAQSWQPVGNGVSSGGSVNTLFVYDSIMYVGGHFSSPGNNIAQWNGSVWDTLISGTDGEVYCMGLYNDTLYAGGFFSKAGGHSAGGLAKLEGKKFAGTNLNFEGGPVLAIHQYNSLLYVSGNFDSINHRHYGGFISWDGNKSDSIDNYTGWGGLDAMTVFDSLLYLGAGYPYPILNSGIPIVTWNNSIIGYSGNDYFYSNKTDDFFYQSTFFQTDSILYMGGYFSHVIHLNKFNRPQDTFYLNNIAMWNGANWSPLGKGIHGTVNALVSYNSLLIAGGSFDSAGGIPVNNIAAWNGSNWSALASGVNGPVYSLAVFDSVLYAGGSFNSPGNGIVKYAALPKTTPGSDSVNIFPNPSTGQFTVVCNTAIIQNSVVTFEIYNLLGEKIYSSVLISENTIIDLGKQTAGVYIYGVSNAEGNLISPGKLVIE